MNASRAHPIAEPVHYFSLRAIRVAGFVSLLLLTIALLAFLIRLRMPGRWTGLFGMWSACAAMIAAGIGSFAKARLDATAHDTPRSRRLAIALLHLVLGVLYIAGGCGGVWAFTVTKLHGGR
jgi:hypothetical protein